MVALPSPAAPPVTTGGFIGSTRPPQARWPGGPGVARALEPFGLFWLEEPVNCEDFDGYFLVAEKLNIRVVGGEKNFTRFDLRPFFRNPRIPIFMPDVMRGGLTEMRNIAAVADTWGMTISPHLFPELMVQVMASIPNCLMLEFLDFLDDLWLEPVLPTNGMISPSQKPGQGLSFKEEILRGGRILG